MRDYFIAWWNLENLFDEEDAEALGRRSDKVSRAIGGSITGWTPQLRDRKINQLASVIAGMNAGAGPDLLGVCEVENRFVVDRLVDQMNATLHGPRNYAVVHADTDDDRGIDVAFIYDADLFQVPNPREESVFFHVVMRRNATREIVQVTFTTAAGRTLVVFGNHWPSRSGGQYESAGYRAIAGETLAYFHERVIEVLGADTAVMVMGDFNDEPFNASLVLHGLSARQAAKVTNARTKPLLWNLMWPPGGTPDGSFYFDNEPNILDQFLVNKNMVDLLGPLHVRPETALIHKSAPMTHTGDYPKPIPFGGMGKTVNQNGYSDHFPITVTITEAD
ncbi:endonuclease/exonuclease/phosphatase family protein [uncultured Phycicoccus sp.]|uniref:endonuclease/exonuclease/phosphatase family protein n=1 Tax=uncultured Phycicoccus sp. TaxID=661422 RepID=UPI00260A2DF4|nr:endonuclease/exonuclease/phosphatase family protein [uncultured Phycicoccus sp.]